MFKPIQTANFIKTQIKGYEVHIYKLHFSDELQIIKDDEKVYGAAVTRGTGLERAVAKISEIACCSHLDNVRYGDFTNYQAETEEALAA